MNLRNHIDMDEFARLWSDKVSVGDIAARFAISTTSVWRLRQSHGIPDRELPHCCEPQAPSPEDEAASCDSLAFSPWVASRIRELGLGMPA